MSVHRRRDSPSHAASDCARPRDRLLHRHRRASRSFAPRQTGATGHPVGHYAILVVMSTNLEAFDELVAQLRELFFALRGVTARMLVDLGCTAVDRGVLYEIDRLGPQTVPAMARARAV